MGVSGSGKSSVGALLASELGWKFYDADDYHPEGNRVKMSSAIPLDDQVTSRDAQGLLLAHALRNHSWRCSGNPMGCWESNQGLSRARQKPYRLCYRSSPQIQISHIKYFRTFNQNSEQTAKYRGLFHQHEGESA